MTRCAYNGSLGLLLLLLTIGVPATSQAKEGSFSTKKGLFSKGRMNVGLGAGGATGTFTVAGNFGYFVLDGLRPGIATTYTYKKQSGYTTNEVVGELSLRYYVMEPAPIAPFVVVDTSIIHLSFGGDYVKTFGGAIDGDYTYYGVGAGAGLFVRMGKSLGIEGIVGAVQYLGVDSVLTERKAVPEGISFRWSVGLALFF